MPLQTFEQEIRNRVKSLQDKPAAANGEPRISPQFTPVAQDKPAFDLMDAEHLIGSAQQRYDEACRILNSIELEFQLEKTKLIEELRTEIETIKQKAQRKLFDLSRNYEGRKAPAQRMIALVSRLSDPSTS